jgi:hypothetical protein
MAHLLGPDALREAPVTAPIHLEPKRDELHGCCQAARPSRARSKRALLHGRTASERSATPVTRGLLMGGEDPPVPLYLRRRRFRTIPPAIRGVCRGTCRDYISAAMRVIGSRIGIHAGLGDNVPGSCRVLSELAARSCRRARRPEGHDEAERRRVLARPHYGAGPFVWE